MVVPRRDDPEAVVAIRDDHAACLVAGAHEDRPARRERAVVHSRCNGPRPGYARAMGEGLKRYFIPGVIGFAPLATFLLTWDVASYGKMTSIIRALSLPELSAELAAIAIAFAEGMLPWLKRIKPPRYALIALGVLIAVAIGTIAVAPNRLGAASHTFFWIVHLCFGFSIAFLCGRVFRGSDLVRCYLLGFAAFAAAFAVFAITNFHRPLDWTRDLPAVVHIRHLGIYATPIIGLCIGLMATASRKEVWIGACAV